MKKQSATDGRDAPDRVLAKSNGLSTAVPCRETVPSSLSAATNSREAMNVHLTSSVLWTQRFGGVSRYLVELLRGLVRRVDVKPTIFAPFYINEYYHQTRELHSTLGSGFRISRCYRGLDRALRCLNHMNWRRGTIPDLLHTTNFENTVGRTAGIPRVATFYDMIYERFTPNAEVLKRKQQVLESSARCIAISQATKNDMIKFLDADPDKIDVVHLGSDMGPADSPHPALGEIPYLLWVGGRAGYKNFSRFLVAFSRTRVCRDGMMVVCAGGPPFSLHEQAEIDRLRLRNLLHVQPNEQSLRSLYTFASALIYASEYEGFGIPPLEAMRCGCPVIASSAGSIGEVVADAAVTFDPTDAESMTNAVDHVLASEERRSELAEAGRRRANDFTWDKCVTETVRVYEKVLWGGS